MCDVADTDQRGENRLDRADVETDPAARGVLYQTLVRAFEHPTADFYSGLADGRVERGLRETLAKTPLEVAVPTLDPGADVESLSTRYTRLFVLGQAVVTDRTDGSLEKEGPAVSLYESGHRDDATWNTINEDLARAYEYYGLSVNEDERDHHDNLGLQLEFAGYLARREALGESDAAAARRDFLDRHLTVFAPSLREELTGVNDAGVYADFAVLLDRLVATDHEDLATRLDSASTTDEHEVTW